ncbi:hypothetical protein VTO42DRAFT_4442 [Malbranchea cinnamomea]
MMDAHAAAVHPQLSQLRRLLQHDFTDQLTAVLARSSTSSAGGAFLRIEATLCSAPDPAAGGVSQGPATPENRLILGYIDLSDVLCSIPQRPGAPETDTGTGTATDTGDGKDSAQESSEAPVSAAVPAANRQPLTPDSLDEEPDSPLMKRRKVVGGLRLPSPHASSDEGPDGRDQIAPEPAARQVHSQTRFPQRRPRQEPVIPTLEPTSGDKLILGIWRQIFSNIRLSRSTSALQSSISHRGVVDREAFRAINATCLEYCNHSHSARAVEMIVQAYWVECYEARIVALTIEKPLKTLTEIKREALKEACATFQWKEKELRNKL